MVKRGSCLLLATALLAVGLFCPLKTYAEEVKKEQLVGRTWYYKKKFYVFHEDGTYELQVRLRKKKAISCCGGKFKIQGNTITCEGFCFESCDKSKQEPSGLNKFRWEVTSINEKQIKADQVVFGVQLPEEGVRTSKVFKRFNK